MLDAGQFSVFETLRDGRRVEIRALKPADRPSLLTSVGRTSAQSLYRRFFTVKRSFTEQEAEFFINVDFADHVALVAVSDQGGRTEIIGGGRYVLVRPGVAELAFTVVDEHQGKGLGAALMRHLVTIARQAELVELIAEVLPDNPPMLRLFKKSGFSTKRKGEVVHAALNLTAKAYSRGDQ